MSFPGDMERVMKELFSHTLFFTVNLWGQNITAQIRVYLYSPNTVIANQIFQQRSLPSKGLGEENKGRIHPIIPSKSPL